MTKIGHRHLKVIGYPFFLIGLIVSKFHAGAGYVLIGVMAALWGMAGILETLEILRPMESDA
jgi:hypothetical protein